MNSFASLLSPIVLLIPALSGSGPAPDMHGERALAPGQEQPAASLGAEAQEGRLDLQQARREPLRHQVRIEGRVVVRISPGSSAARDRMMASMPRSAPQARVAEVEHGDCVPIDGILGVQPTRDNRLMFVMRDREVLLASLERSCTARAFYSDSYVERSDDGQICVNRDQLRSRAGASCEVASFSRLVAVSE